MIHELLIAIAIALCLVVSWSVCELAREVTVGAASALHASPQQAAGENCPLSVKD